jgi:hypothetical protein
MIKTKIYPIECPTCLGEGKVQDNSVMGIYYSKKRKCKACKGTGVIKMTEKEQILYEVDFNVPEININTLNKDGTDNKN